MSDLDGMSDLKTNSAPPWRRWLPEPLGLWLAALLVVVVIAGGSVAILSFVVSSPSGCSPAATIQVAAAPAIADAIGQVSRTVPISGCYELEVVSRDSAAMAQTLANPPASGLPDVWIPESTFWLRRARSLGAFQVPATGTPIASSPVVLAMTAASATRLGWPSKQVPWSALLAPDASGGPVGIPDPASDPVGVSALIGIKALTATAPADVAALRRISPYATARAADLYQRLPTAGATQGALSAFLTSEQEMAQYNMGVPKQDRLVASYPPVALPTLDYPYVVLPGASAQARTGAARFLATLLSAAARPVLGGQGLRGPDGRLLPGALADAGARREDLPVAALPDEGNLLDLLNTWTGVHLAAQLLGVIDISGSMADPLPGGGDTKLSAVVKAAQDGLGLLLDSTQVAVWEFATNVVGNQDYRVVLPYTTLGGGGRSAVYGALSRVQVKANGNTALYNTVLAAYQTARRGWTPGRINLLLIATDGQNDDPGGGLTRAQLLQDLRALQDPRRPLPILFIGLSGGINVGELQDIAGATGGTVYVTKDPSGIRQIFFDALAKLACQPPACRPGNRTSG